MQETAPDIDRRPGGVEEGEDAVAGQELADLGQVAEGALHRRTRLAQVGLEAGIEDAGAQYRIEPNAGTHQQARARPLGQRSHREQEQGDQRHRQQRELAATDHHRS